MVRDPGPPRGLLRVPPASAGEHARIAPTSAALAEHVAHFWWVRWDRPRAATVESLPHPSVHLAVEPRRASVVGVARGVFRRRLPPAGYVFGVKFRPAAFFPWLGRAVSSVTDQRVPLTGILPATYAHEIRAASSLAVRCAIAERYLLARLPVLPPEVIAIRDLVERVAKDPDLVRVPDLAALAGVDVRTLQRRFLQLVGVPPKWVIERYRLHEAAALLASGTLTIGAIAARLGYFDQAHFVRAFKAVVGAPPSDFVRT